MLLNKLKELRILPTKNLPSVKLLPTKNLPSVKQSGNVL